MRLSLSIIILFLFFFYSCNNQIPEADGGEDIVVYDADSCQLQAKAPVEGSGRWFLRSGANGIIRDAYNPESFFKGKIGSSYTLIWNVTTKHAFANDMVQVRFEYSQEPKKAYAGEDTIVFDNNSLTLCADSVTCGRGCWKVLEGTGGVFSDSLNNHCVFTGQLGVCYRLQWHTSFVDIQSRDDIKVCFYTTAKAGNDTVVLNNTETTLNANEVSNAPGKWEIVSGTGGLILQPANPTSVFRGNYGISYKLSWSLTYPEIVSTDEVKITFTSDILPTVANAGPDTLVYMNTVLTLQGNTPLTGNGSWEIISGNGGTFDDNTNPQAEFTGVYNETYLLRWTISNDNGSFSDTVSIFFKDFTCGDNITDSRDGQQYETVLIGTQCWFAENINIGTFITTSSNQTDNQIIEKFCYQNTSSNCTNFGGLYQWDEMMQYVTIESSQGICPQGWHIPSDEEFKQLEMYLGMSQTDADKNNVWRGNIGLSINNGGSSGYDALYSGAYTTWFGFFNKGSNEYPWTSTESGTYAFRRCIGKNISSVGRYDSYQKNSGLSVRCVKD